MTSFFERNPWARHENSRRPITIYAGKIFAPLVLLGTPAIIAVEMWLFDSLSSGPIAVRIALQIVIAVALAAALLLVAFLIPTYKVFNVAAEHIGAGAVLLDQDLAFLGQATVVTHAFTFHGQHQSQVWIALVDGREVDADPTSLVQVAQPHDYFRRFRARPTTGRSAPEQPSDSALDALVTIWDLRLNLGQDDIRVSEIETVMTRSAKAELDELVRLRLVETRRRGFGSRATSYVALLPGGIITLASELRERGVEIFNNAKKEIPVMTIHNSGVIMNGSPGAVANVGSGYAIGSVAPEITAILTRLSEAVEALSALLPDPDSQVALDEALEELGHELSHPQPSEQRLKKISQSAVELGGSSIAGFLGNAAWGVLAAWLGLSGPN